MSVDMLIDKINLKRNPTVAGLDPRLDYIPAFIKEKHFEKCENPLKAVADAFYEFNCGIIDALKDVVPAVKIQSACYEAYGYEGIRTLCETIDYAQRHDLYVIVDAKRNDIGSTAREYATAYLGESEIEGKKIRSFNSDAVTVTPYLGSDGVLPFVELCCKFERMIFVLAKTSNQSSGELQDLLIGEETVFERVGRLIETWGEGCIGKYGFSSVGAVVGATYPAQLSKMRELLPKVFFLVPGYGAQGGKAEDVRGAFDENGFGAIINSSRSILSAWKNNKTNDYVEAAREEAIRMRDELREIIK